jgi:tRNA modification GTPase
MACSLPCLAFLSFSNEYANQTHQTHQTNQTNLTHPTNQTNQTPPPRPTKTATFAAMNLPNTADTIVALATPPGIGAIGVIRLSGPHVFYITESIFKGKKMAAQPSHTAHFGHIVDINGGILDEVLMTIFKNPHSYTGEDTAEISCHGSPYILQQVMQRCLEAGARLAQPGEYTLRAFLNGKLDLTQAEAVADLIASESAAQHDVALRQLRGGFKKEIQVLRDELIHFASLVELELDFGEEDVEFADRTDLRRLVEQIRAQIRPLIQSFALGNALKTGVTTVIAGRPNAGKSTLLNALLNEERAIVSDIAGTTRDTIEEVLNIKGVQFRLVDTAGIREAQDTIENIGIQRTMEKIGQASILVYVWDVVGGMSIREVWEDLEKLAGNHDRAEKNGKSIIVVCNKMDGNPNFRTDWLFDPTLPNVHPYLLDGQTDATISQQGPNLKATHLVTAVPVSAKNQMNIEFLKENLFTVAVGDDTTLGQGTVVVSNARHHDALRRADAALLDVLQGLEQHITGDFIAQDIRRSLAYLGEITGEIGVEDLLGNIFGKFCIGK